MESLTIKFLSGNQVKGTSTERPANPNYQTGTIFSLATKLLDAEDELSWNDSFNVKNIEKEEKKDDITKI